MYCYGISMANSPHKERVFRLGKDKAAAEKLVIETNLLIKENLLIAQILSDQKFPAASLVRMKMNKFYSPDGQVRAVGTVWEKVPDTNCKE